MFTDVNITQVSLLSIHNVKWVYIYIYIWLILGLRPASERRRNKVTASPIGWVQT